MTVGDVAQKMSVGVEFYRHQAGNKVVINTGITGIFIGSDCAEMDLISLRMELDDGHIFRKIEDPWWKGREGCIIMVVEFMSNEWFPIVFQSYHKDSICPFKSNEGGYYPNARPLTATEKDAIITRN